MATVSQTPHYPVFFSQNPASPGTSQPNPSALPPPAPTETSSRIPPTSRETVPHSVEEFLEEEVGGEQERSRSRVYLLASGGVDGSFLRRSHSLALLGGEVGSNFLPLANRHLHFGASVFLNGLMGTGNVQVGIRPNLLMPFRPDAEDADGHVRVGIPVGIQTDRENPQLLFGLSTDISLDIFSCDLIGLNLSTYLLTQESGNPDFRGMATLQINPVALATLLAVAGLDLE